MSDGFGNLTSNGVRTHVWDARNRLTAITGVASFTYDAFGRRQTATRGGTATSFLYDGWDVAQEQQAGSPSADSVLGLGVDERFARNGATFLTDALGSTVALASSGAVQTSYGYDACGVAQVTGTASDNPFQYTGRENDGTGLLLHCRNRYYSPAWARFVSEDPIGLGGGDINLYRYVANNPVQPADPSGNCPICYGILAAAYAAGMAAQNLVRCYLSGACLPPAPPPTPASAYPQVSPAPANNPAAGGCSGSVSCSTGDDAGKDGATTEPDRAGKPFTKKGKETVSGNNAAANDGTMRCENCGQEVVQPEQYQKGVTPPDNEAHVDHIDPKFKGGAQVR